MTFNPQADVSGSSTRRGGRTAVIAGGGVVGLGGLALLILNLLTGGDLGSVLGGLGQDQGQQPAPTSTVDNCKTGADANEDISCRLAATQIVLDQYWSGEVKGYRAPGSILVDGSTSTPCGTASNQTGPFYCPPNETVYVDPTFFDLMRQQFGASAGNLAQLYVLAHEWGHHIQNIAGIMKEHPNNGTGPDSNGVRVELQADCFAGGWIKHMSEQTDKNGQRYLQPPTTQELNDALNAASSVGDDNIQSQTTGQVNPESWTHGSSEQRQKWFSTGYEKGIEACDTFQGAP